MLPSSTLRRLTVLLLAVLTALIGGVATAGTASAHDELESSTPKAGSTVTAPTEVVLRFSDRVLPDFTRMVLTSPAGATADTPTTTSGDTVTGALPADVAAGGWTATWRISSADGHPVSGTLRFTVKAAATPTATSTPTTLAATAAPTPAPTAAPASAPVSSSSSGTVTAVLGVVVIVVLALLALVVRRARRQPRG